MPSGCVQNIGINNCDICIILFFPFRLLLEIISRKGMIYPRFSRQFHMVNGFETIVISSIPQYYISNKLSYLEKDQGMRKIHLSQGSYIYGINGTFPKAFQTIDIWILLTGVKIPHNKGVTARSASPNQTHERLVWQA